MAFALLLPTKAHSGTDNMNGIKKLTALLLICASGLAHGELPTALTDKIYQGSGSIDLLQDATAAELGSYIDQNGAIFFGVDLNEAASGNESSDSVGVAIRDITLSIQTTSGTYEFSAFETNTTANILASGSASAEEYYTLFGTAGSNQLTGGTGDFSFSTFDDVIRLNDVAIEGEILSATMTVDFLDTAGNGSNETFFDYGAGFEEFAILGEADAQSLENANVGISDATPTEVSFAVTVPTGAPEPWWFLFLALPLIQLLKRPGAVKS